MSTGVWLLGLPHASKTTRPLSMPDIYAFEEHSGSAGGALDMGFEGCKFETHEVVCVLKLCLALARKASRHAPISLK